MTARGLLLIAVLAATADASVWDRALTSPRDQATRDLYDARMLAGDHATVSATIQASSPDQILLGIRRAEEAYREAAALRPDAAEPHFRIGNLFYQMHFDCDNIPFNRPPSCAPAWATRARMQAVVEAWDAFERLAPLDPRVGDLLVKRALLNTKMITGGPDDRRHLEAAARDYEAALDRSDGLTGARGDEQLLGNLAETYMMLNRLDQAIATYQRAIAVGAARVSTVYGLAVALDRDGSGSQASRRILAQGAEGFEQFKRDFIRRSVFYVPEGESNYYFALIHEAFGNDGAALELWNRYLASGAHPEFHPRAREHIELLRKRRVRPQLPPPDPEDLGW
jgi:tetratricopeptide (TPR) repeat protein